MEARLTPVTLHNYYGKDVQESMAEFNADLAAVETARAKLATAAAELRAAAIAGTIQKPERLAADADALRAESAALDVAELRLIGRKAGFQEPVIAARSEEKKRLAELGKKRVAEVRKKLEAVAPESRYAQGIINEDSRVLELSAMQGAVSGFVRVVTEADNARLVELQTRLAATVPSFTSEAPRHSVFK